jgi:streptogramin lyase
MSPSGVLTRVPVGKLYSATVGNEPGGSLIVNALTAKGQRAVFDVSTSGVIARDKVPAAISSAFLIYLGAADGSLWFTDGTGKIGRITPNGVATAYNRFVRGRGVYVDSMAVGRDGNLYVLADGFGTLAHPAATVFHFLPSKLTRVC